jgi:acetyltransferase-like isoleucine patch superfamily enzyme
VALSVSSLLSTSADSKLQLRGCCPLKTPAYKGAIHPTSKLVGFLAHFYKLFFLKNLLNEVINLGRCHQYIRNIIIVIGKAVIISIFKIIGPPRILRYGSPINIALLKAFGANVGEKAVICSPVVLHNAKGHFHHLTIEDHCNISGNNYLDLSGNITLEKGVSLGPGVIIMTHNRYNFNAFLEEKLAHTCGVKDVLIKEGSGIKAGALIIHGITIGKNAVVGGNSVVNRDVPDNCFVAGVPAHKIKEII